MQALRELNFDHRMGKISDEDFAVFELNLKQHAAETLRALDEWEAQTEDDLDQSLEREIAARRSQLISGARACPSCGRPAADDDKFCAICGAALAQAPAPVVLLPAGIVCPNAAGSADPDDRFCAGCGARPQCTASARGLPRWLARCQCEVGGSTLKARAARSSLLLWRSAGNP